MTPQPQLAAAWQRAFARQAYADLQVYNLLASRPAVPQCFRLHFLQMFLEKLAKAYLHSQSQTPEKQHNYIAKVIPLAIRENWRVVIGATELSQQRFQQIRQLCRELDLLQPTVDDGGRRPDNCEYPWASFDPDAPLIQVPAEYEFPVAARLYGQDGRELLKTASFLAQQLAK